MKKILLIIGLLFVSLQAFATGHTYYISKSLGSDFNTSTQAQSKSTPWAHLPGMASCTSNCAAYSPVAGDEFILYGGDTWVNSDLGINWIWSGSSSTATSSCLGNGATCAASGYIYIGVDQTWYSGSSWTRPIWNAGGSAVTAPGGVGNVIFRLYDNHTILDNVEFTGLFWSGAPAYGTGTNIAFAGGTPGQGIDDIIEHVYIHGWSHGTYGGGTDENPCGITGDTGIPNNNANSILYQNVIDGTDTDKASCSAIFGGPPNIEQNFVQYVSSAAIVNGPVLVDSNVFQNIVPSFDTAAHENCLEINAAQAVQVSNNVCAHLGSGVLGFWIAPYPSYTATVFNNVIFDTDTGNIFDIAPAVYTSGNCTSGGTYCTVSGTTNAYNNSIECGPNSNPNAVCFAGISSTATAVTLENNQVITNATTPNGGLWSTSGGPTPTTTTNLVQTLSVATGQGYNESEAYPFSPTSGGSTIGAGTNLTSALCGSFASLCSDTTVGVAYNSSNHTVVYPDRTTNSRPSSGSWDDGAYLYVAAASSGAAQFSGHSVFNGSGMFSGLSSTGSCQAPNFCAYAGADLVATPTPPNFNSDATGLYNNNLTAYDTSYLGHTNANGTIYSNSALLSPITRATDSLSVVGTTCPYNQAGLGGSSDLTLTNLNTTLVSLGCGSLQHVGLFNPTGTNKGHFTPLPAGCSGTGCGDYITTNMNIAGGGSASQAEDVGSPVFSQTNNAVLFTFGTNAYDSLGALNVTPFTINYAANAPLSGYGAGFYQIDSPVVNFAYGLPAQSAVNWATGTHYPYGAYVIHPLATSEMWNGTGSWVSGVTVNVGDIIDSELNSSYSVSSPTGSYHCMYKATTGGTTAGTVPAFIDETNASSTANPCRLDSIKESATGGGAVVWHGTASQPQFIYQNTTASCTPYCTSSTVSSWLTSGHPDFLGTASDTGGAQRTFTWTNVGTAYIPTNSAQFWQALGGVSGDTNYGGYPSQYAIDISTNSYGNAAVGYSKYNADQGTGVFNIVADAAASSHGTFHELNTATGIWVDHVCGSGSLASCGSMTANTIGGLTAIINPLGTGQVCPYLDHNLKLSRTGQYAISTNQADVYSACNSLENFFGWSLNASAFCGSLTVCGSTPGSLQIADCGLNHWAIGTNILLALEGGCFSYTGGAYTSIYTPSSVSTPPVMGTWLVPLASQSTAQTTPPGCYVSVSPDLPGNGIKSPDCNLSEVLDGHPSLVAGDSNPAVGAFYNYNTLGPAFAAFQNEIMGYPTTPTGCDPSVNAGCSSWGNPLNPGVTFNLPFRFAHTWSTGNSLDFDNTFVTGEYSQDGNWFFVTTNLGCTVGSTTGAVPLVWSSGTYFQTLSLTAVPANPTSLCGYPWIPSTSYTAGNIIVPIEGTSGPGAVDDAFQATTNGTSGANSTLNSNQPACLQYMLVSGTWTASTKGSCFEGTNSPSIPNGGVFAITAVANASGGNTVYTGTISGGSGSGVVPDTYTFAGLASGANNGTFACSASTGTTLTCANPSGVAASAQTGTATDVGMTVTAATESGTTGSFTLNRSVKLNVGAKVTLAGFTPSGWNGTFAVTGTVGTDCPGTNCGAITSFQLAGLPSSLGTVTVFGNANSQGDTVCDSPSDNGSGSVNSFNPSSCSGGEIWSDRGLQTSRSDVIGINLGVTH